MRACESVRVSVRVRECESVRVRECESERVTFEQLLSDIQTFFFNNLG